MESFLINITSFPTAIYSTLLVVVIGYWLISFVSNFDFDDFDVGIDADLDVDTETKDVGRITGLLSTLGLTGVPITIVITLLVLNAWFICYFASLLTPQILEYISVFKLLIDLAIIVISFMISIVITAIMIKPLKPMFKKINQEPLRKSIIGSSCKVRSSRVDNSFGEADCQLEGASLIVKVRTKKDQTFTTGDKVVVVEHNPENNTFFVISEKEFKQELS
jgi:hypothetical protein